MNRSILIVICDFLLLSLLTFSTDITHMAGEKSQPATTVQVVANPTATAASDLAAAMKTALTEERKSQAQLQQQLAATREAAAQQQAALNERQRENRQLERQYTSAQASVERLKGQLQSAAALSQRQLAATEARAQQESDMAALLRRQIGDLAASNQTARAQAQQLQTRLQLAEVRQRAATEQAALMQQEVQATRAENTRLAEGLKTLATNSTQLATEIRENRALAPNAIFAAFLSNSVQAAMAATRTSFFAMDTTRRSATHTVLATDGAHVFAVCHVDGTPLTLWDPGTDWDKLTGTLGRRGRQLAIQSLSFDARDPRVVLIPVSRRAARDLNCNVYRLSSDPYKFQDAVLVGANEDYYGQCNFQIDVATPQYVKLDRSLLKGLFGHFNPSRGDFVFSRTGELLGIMVNDTYCLTLHAFEPAATFAFNQSLKGRSTGGTLAQLYDGVFRLPQRLQ
ncbi:MAG: hypothetical protein KGJ88_01520 [Verrucomicrobiota bacterium]|nr:hypothetical protein [Verrucomicrobiota bacterium]